MSILGCVAEVAAAGRFSFGRFTLLASALISLAQLDAAIAAESAAIARLLPAGLTPAELTFEKDVRPILRAHCFDCHGSQEVHKAGLDLRLTRLMAKGGDSGPAVVPGSPEQSYLLDRIKTGEMPPGEHKVPEKEIAVIQAWIAAGAKTARVEPTEIGRGLQITEEDRALWPFRPIRRPKVPAFEIADRVRTPIDAFLVDAMRTQHDAMRAKHDAPRAKHDAAGAKRLTFSPDADQRTLMRRLFLDFIGRPPEPDDVAAFVADASPDAYERLVDRLLVSPHYGERWGRHWLDVAGYADSEGYDDNDAPRPHAYKYRDYVVRSLNQNKPFDRFLIEQLAGDELVPPPYSNLSADAVERLTATGFLRMAADGTATAGANVAAASNQVVADTIKIVSTSLLGLTVGCAQCHDHRYDPITQEDYYRLRAVFEPALNWKNWRVPSARRVSLMTDAERAAAAAVEASAAKVIAERNAKEQRSLAAALEKELGKFDPELRGRLKAALDAPGGKRTAEQSALLAGHPSVNISPGTLYQYDQAAADDLKKDDARIDAIRSKKPVEDFLRTLTENSGEAPPTFLFFRGEHQQPRHEIKPGDLTVCVFDGTSGAVSADDSQVPTTGRRLAYARRLTSGTHPLVGRVLANRMWMLHFGRGIAGTPADFGRLGESPTHPELLDWLASEFAAGGWDLKRLHRLIVTSTAYRQVALRTPDRDAVDPDNRLYSRMNVRRLDAEILRDSILAVSGAAYSRMFGPAVPVKEDAVGQIVVGVDSKVDANRPGADVSIGPEEFRRSIYVEVRRSRPLAMLRSFDAPVMETNCDRRIASTAAPQALMLMNSDFALTQSRRFAERLVRETGPDAHARITRAYQLAFNRPPDSSEVRDAARFLETQAAFLRSQFPQEKPAETSLKATTSFCQALIGSNEFLYSD